MPINPFTCLSQRMALSKVTMSDEKLTNKLIEKALSLSSLSPLTSEDCTRRLENMKKDQQEVVRNELAGEEGEMTISI